MKLLLTGSSGFVGARVEYLAAQQGWFVQGVARYGSAIQAEPQNERLLVSSIDGETDWSGAFDGVDCVVHCAARVHQMEETESDALAAYRETNLHGTLNLAEQAAKAGVKRFVFLSSIKVNGEFTYPNQAFKPNNAHIPSDPYGLSKYEAERGLLALAERTGLEVVIVRPPLVYGPGVRANFLTMMNWVNRRLPLPLGAIHNQRSLVYVDNLADLVLTCCSHPAANGQIVLASDDQDISTTELLKAVAKAMGKRSMLLPIPMKWIGLLTKVIGKPEIAQRLCGNLQVDITQTKVLLNWAPKISFEQGIERTVQDYLTHKNNSI